jgi:hypothetical protein
MLVPTNDLPMEIHPADGSFAASPMAGNVHELVEFDEAPAFVSEDSDGAGNGGSASSAPRRPR